VPLSFGTSTIAGLLGSNVTRSRRVDHLSALFADKVTVGARGQVIGAGP
jgi:hypothetical protein